MSLAKAIQQTMIERGLTTVQVARRLAQSHDRATFYRLLGGKTTEPRLDTLIQLCRVLQISPTELLERAELWPYQQRRVGDLDRRLRECFAHLQAVPYEQKRQAAAAVCALVRALTALDEQAQDQQPDVRSHTGSSR